MFIIFHSVTDNCQDNVCCHEPFRWHTFFLYVCVLEIYNLNHCILFFFSGRGGGGVAFSQLP